MEKAMSDDAGTTKEGRSRSLAGVWLPPLLALVVIGGAWQLFAVHNPYVLPRLSQVLENLKDRPRFYVDDALTTLREALIGAAIGMGAAFVLAVLMCYVKLVERAILPLAVILNVTPVIAIAPGLVVAFGFGSTPKYVITSVLVFFPFLINSLTGLRSVDVSAMEVFRSLHASNWEILYRLRLPSSVPFLFAGARICMPLSLIGAVVAEFVAPGTGNGLGSTIVSAASVSDLKTIYASVVLLSLIGIVLFGLVLFAQGRLVTWNTPAAQTSLKDR
jgi:NitT/TauT family transport system permease protein